MNLLSGYKTYKDVQGKEYSSVSEDIKKQLKQFRKNLGIFTDKQFINRGLVTVPNGKGMWQNSGNFTKYMWNRYKFKDDINSNLVIYFNASTDNSEGLFVSIGLIDDRLNEFEKVNNDKIYKFLEDECKKINCPTFERKNTGGGERVFRIIDENNYDKADYDCLVTQLQHIYTKTIRELYASEQNNETNFKLWLKEKGNQTSTRSNYTIHLREHIPSFLKKINIDINNIFMIDDIVLIEGYLKEFQKNGQLYDLNKEKGRFPSASLGAYIDYLKEFKNDTPNTMKNKNNILNQILYGPPGTGKTYNTIDKALEIIDGILPTSREEAKARFEVLKDAGQIEFVTFHQSYGYEEFIEGIKADVESDDIRYSIEDGIFKRLSQKAKRQYEDSKKSQSELASDISQKDKIGDFLNRALEEEEVFQKTKGGKFGIKDLTDKSIILYSEDSNYNENSISLDVEEFYKIIDANIDFKTSRQIAQEVFSISNQRQKDTYYLSLFKEYKKAPFIETQINTEIVKNKNYLLIIDEINRGNISKIFGELITLIEESKRLGNDEAMEVTLPYSGEKFGVPKNLYIMGTMNTADRSIALMDTALRRRFEFEEMMPNYGVIKKEVGDNGIIDGIDIALLLEKINKRIEYLYDRDHTIGHAYFLKAKDKSSLDSVMRNQVIPLLQEYFYDDWEKVRLVLNDGFIERITQDASKLFDSMDDEYMEEDKYTYSIVKEFKESDYKRIYGDTSETNNNA